MSSLQPVTLITGASAGIGAALAQVFTDRAHKVVLVARREAQLREIAGSIAARSQSRPAIVALDLTLPDAGDRLARALHEAGFEPEFVVNNAGFGLVGSAAELDRTQQLAMIDLNVRVLTDLSLRFVDSLSRRRGGILNVASVAGFMPGPGMAVYYATKSYVLSFSEALHHELSSQGVRVTVLCPGPVETEFQARAGMPDDHFPHLLARSAERVAREGYEGLMRGKSVVVPGTANKIATILPRLLPRGVMPKMIQRFQRWRVGK
jgi:short-subunit dehydrogenase